MDSFKPVLWLKSASHKKKKKKRHGCGKQTYREMERMAGVRERSPILHMHGIIKEQT